MTDPDLAAAEAVIAAYGRGDYDTQLGVSPETRELLNKASGTDPLTRDDLARLVVLNRPDLIVAAHRAGRIDLPTNGA